MAAARPSGRARRRQSRPPRARRRRARAAAGCGGASWTRGRPCAGRRGPCRAVSEVEVDEAEGEGRGRRKLRLAGRLSFGLVSDSARWCERSPRRSAHRTSSARSQTSSAPSLSPSRSLPLASSLSRLTPCRSYAPLSSSGAPVSRTLSPARSPHLVAHLVGLVAPPPRCSAFRRSCHLACILVDRALPSGTRSSSCVHPAPPPPPRRSPGADPAPPSADEIRTVIKRKDDHVATTAVAFHSSVLHSQVRPSSNLPRSPRPLCLTCPLAYRSSSTASSSSA